MTDDTREIEEDPPTEVLSLTGSLTEEEGGEVRIYFDGGIPPGTLLAGRFQIVRWIAAGGMGEVYEALDCELKKKVAVKLIKAEIAENERAMARFRREISLAHRVTHPSVCRVFDLFFDSPPQSGAPSSHVGSSGSSSDEVGLVFLSMELLDGPTLEQHLRQSGPMSTTEALPIVEQIVSALTAAHTAGVIHRDLKCSNVMLMQKATGVRAVITDFGLAAETGSSDRSRDVSATGEVIGSPAYMAPEQVLGQKVTLAADIYALGVVMYRMVAGRLPFDGRSPYAALAWRFDQLPTPPAEHVPELDRRWNAAIMRCLAIEPADRFASAGEVLEVLGAGQGSGEAEPPEPSRPAASDPDSRSLGYGAAVLIPTLVAVLVLAGLALVWARRERAPSPEIAASPAASSAAQVARRSVAVLGFKNISGRSEADWMSTALTELLTTELAGGDQLRIVPSENVARMKRDLELEEMEGLAADTLERVGRHLHSDYVVFGSYFADENPGAGRLRVDLRVQETVGDSAMMTLSDTSTLPEFLDLVARVGVDLRRQLGVQGLVAGAKATVLPASPAAARLFGEGLAALNSFRVLEARDLLSEAVALEGDFPLAHSALADAYSSLGFDKEAQEQIQLAFELSTDLPRRERLQIEGKLRELTGDWVAAAECYRTLYEFFPDYLDYGLDLFRVLVEGGQTSEAGILLDTLRQRSPKGAEDPRISSLESRHALNLGQFSRALEAAIRTEELSLKMGARFFAGRAVQEQSRALLSLGRWEEAEQAARDSEETLSLLGDRAGVALSLILQGYILDERCERDAAIETFDRALAMFREIGRRDGVNIALNNKAVVVKKQGDLKTASRLYEESLAIARETNDQNSLGAVLFNLAQTRLAIGDPRELKAMFEESLEILRRMNHPRKIGKVLEAIAAMAYLEGDLREARKRAEEARPLYEESGDSEGIGRLLLIAADVDLAENNLDSAGRGFQEALDLGTRDEVQDNRVESMLGLLRLTLARDQFQEAADLAAQIVGESEKYFQAEARGLQALATAASGSLGEARELIDQVLAAESLLNDFDLYLSTSLAEARIRAAEGRVQDAISQLERVRERAQKSNRYGRMLEAGLAMGEIELGAGNTDRAILHLTQVQRDATARGFHRLANEAKRAIDSRP